MLGRATAHPDVPAAAVAEIGGMIGGNAWQCEEVLSEFERFLCTAMHMFLRHAWNKASSSWGRSSFSMSHSYKEAWTQYAHSDMQTMPH
jgi:hypothetical protein